MNKQHWSKFRFAQSLNRRHRELPVSPTPCTVSLLADIFTGLLHLLLQKNYPRYTLALSPYFALGFSLGALSSEGSDKAVIDKGQHYHSM